MFLYSAIYMFLYAANPSMTNTEITLAISRHIIHVQFPNVGIKDVKSFFLENLLPLFADNKCL